MDIKVKKDIHEDILYDKAERELKRLLTEAGMVGYYIQRDRDLGIISVVKVLTGDEVKIVDQFRELSKDSKYKTKVTQYEGKGEIWFFKIYIGE